MCIPLSSPARLPRWRLKPLPGLLLALSSPLAWAQVPPDAGALRQQIEQARDLPAPPPVERPEQPAPRLAPPAPPRPDAGGSIVVKSFRFAGNTLVDDARLAPAVAAFVARPIGFEALQRAADAVAAAYREAGWIVHVYLPEQDVSEGVVTLQIVEARYGGMRLETELSSRVSRSDMEGYFGARQQIGQPLSTDDLDRALLLAADLPGVGVTGTLVPGAAEGETDLVLRLTEHPLLSGDVGMDNTGARSTGSQRLTANLNVNSPTGNGEQVNVNFIHSEGSDYGRVALNLPLGYDGLRLTLSASELTYQVIEGVGSQGADPVRGNFGSFGADLSYPLVRSRQQNLYLSGGIENKRFENRDSMVRSDYQSNVARITLSGNRFDGLGAGGVSSASLQMLWGRLADMQVHPLEDSIERSYRKLNYNLSRLQTINAEHSLFLSFSGQYADQVLDSSEKFYLGGANSVRAYPVSEAGGERAFMFTSEWRWNFAPGLIGSVFADAGEVTQLSTVPGESAATLRLRGHGMSINWLGPMGLLTKLTWSRRDGSNPRPTAAGTDSDGTLYKDRFWLSVNMPF